MLVVAVFAIGVSAFLLIKRSPEATRQSKPSSYTELIALPEVELAKVDIALMNLLCAEELLGAENLKVRQCLTV